MSVDRIASMWRTDLINTIWNYGNERETWNEQILFYI